MAPFTVAVCQMGSQNDKDENIDTALGFIDDAASAGADIVTFPEMFPFRGAKEHHPQVAEDIPGPITDVLVEKAADYSMFIHAGSMFETTEEDGMVRNTTVMIDDTGEIIGKYTKLHLFDVTVDDDTVYEESATVVPGDEAVTVETRLATFGLSICYDLRFPELYSTLTQQGATVLFVPAAFTLFTGKDHWQPLLRARAIENQAYIVAPGQIGHNPAPDGKASYGKSMVIDPWGNVISQASDRPEMITAEIDLDYVQEVRQNLPSLQHKRPEAYTI